MKIVKVIKFFVDFLPVVWYTTVATQLHIFLHGIGMHFTSGKNACSILHTYACAEVVSQQSEPLHFSCAASAAHFLFAGVNSMKIQRQKLPYKILMQLAKTKNVFQIVAENTYKPIKNTPIIFAVNHSNCYDVPITATAVGRHVYVLVGKQRLGFLDRFFFSLNGIVYADRMNKKETSEAKKAIINLLKKGHAICWYPEGTWNLTDNLLVLPLKWGIIEVAHKAGAQIIPVGLNYDRDNMICRVKFGIPMAGQSLENKRQAVEELRDAMATLQWDLMNCTPEIHKENIDKEKLKWDVVRAIEEYPPLEPEYERLCIYWPNRRIDTVPPAIIPCLKNAFLFNKRLSG